MSVDISFKRKAYKLDRKSEYDRDIYLCCAMYGSNNLLDLEGNIVKDWTIIGVGEKSDIIRHLLKTLALSCEWGTLRFARSRHTKPENYIKNWREELNKE